MADAIWTGNPRGFNKGRSSKFREGSRIRQTKEDISAKGCGNNNKDEVNSLKTLNVKDLGRKSDKSPSSYKHFMGTCCEAVIVVQNELDVPRSNARKGSLRLLLCQCPWESTNLSLLYQEHISFFDQLV